MPELKGDKRELTYAENEDEEDAGGVQCLVWRKTTPARSEARDLRS